MVTLVNGAVNAQGLDDIYNRLSCYGDTHPMEIVS